MKKKFKFLDFVFSEKYGKGMVHCEFVNDNLGVIFNSHNDIFYYDQFGVGLLDNDNLSRIKPDKFEQRYTKDGVRII